MTPADFRRIALGLEGAEQGSHMGAVDFRVSGRIFATLASVKQGYGNLMLTPDQQAAFVEELPDLFLPNPGGWGRMGMTHIRLAAANREVLEGALRTAWQNRVEKNARAGRKGTGRAKGTKPQTALRQKTSLEKVADEKVEGSKVESPGMARESKRKLENRSKRGWP